MRDWSNIKAAILEYADKIEAKFLPGHICPSCGGSPEYPKWMKYGQIDADFIRIATKMPGPIPCCEVMAAHFGSLESMRLALRSRVEAERIVMLQDIAGVPPRFVDSTLDSYVVSRESAPVLAKVREYCDNLEQNVDEGKGIFMTGKPGSGKTHLGAAVLHHAMRTCPRLSCLFGSMTYSLYRLKRTFEKDGPCDDRDIVDRMVGADLVVIDDLGKEHDTPWVKSMAYLIIDGRYVQKRATIFTTNESMSALVERYDDATVSRITGSCLMLDFSKIRDYRLK